MKLASYLADGQATFGALAKDGLVRMNGRLPAGIQTLRQAIEADCFDAMRDIAARHSADHALADVRFLPVVPDAIHMFAAGVNYRAHVEETGRKVRTMEDGPAFFLRLHSSLVGHGEPIVRPQVSTCFDFEGELALVVGRGGRHIPEASALEHLAGYTCFMDGSVRDYQKHSVSIGKNFQSTGPLGPWMVTRDEIPDPTKLTLVTRLNDEVMQTGHLSDLIFNIPFIVSYLSRITPLQPGDIIATGTPGGVGKDRTPPVWMQRGDRIAVEIEGIGTLTNTVIDEGDPISN
ncbi:fumarylacetoacetate hydrolase family protein [Herbaspirillum lusitanum]|uniref:Fumarylacetoacetate hydrolase family protein n=1 Tax=Herbaspirillum lusitanum TaxID=213312 RepID=A0ABW9AF03_9BURK